MPKWVIGILIIKQPISNNYSQRGFTLMEIILVTMLISIVTVMVGLKISVSENDRAKNEARKIAKLIDLLIDETTATGRPIAFDWDAKANQFNFYMQGESWEKSEDHDLLRPRKIPNEIKVIYVVKSATESKFTIITPNGLIQPFVIKFSGDSTDYIVTINEYYKIEVIEQAKNSTVLFMPYVLFESISVS